MPAAEPAISTIFGTTAHKAAAKFAEDYRRYFQRNNVRVGGGKMELDPLPRVTLVPGLGLFGLGRSKRDAIIAADIAEDWVEGVTDAEAIGRFSRSRKPTCSIANIGRSNRPSSAQRKELPLAGQIAVVTGAGGAIGAATAALSPRRARRSRCST